jgi:hypothetical protein
MSDVIAISGGAGPEEAAAITAIIAQIIEEARIAASHPELVPRHSAWVEAGRLREGHHPTTTHTYDAQPWLATVTVEGA